LADVAAAFRSWSVTPGSNLPNTNTVVGAGLATNLQQIQATTRQYLASIGTSVVGGATTDLSTVDGFTIPISGNATVTSLGSEQSGIAYRLLFSGTPTLKNSTAIQTPGSADMSITSGDVVEVVSLGSGNWKVSSDEAQNKRFSTITAGSIFAGSLNASTSGSVIGTLTATKFAVNANGSFGSALSNGAYQAYGDSILGGVIAGAGSTNDLTWTNKNGSAVAQVPTGGANMTFGAAIGLGAASVFNGVGIAFPIAQVASSDANTLDDYEEGTFTPNVGGTATYNIQTGNYIKFGKMVFIFGVLQINAIGTGSQSTFQGLPFTSDNIVNTDGGVCICQSASLAVSVVSITGNIGASTTTVSLLSRTAAATADAGNNVLGNGATLRFFGTYQASA
jgi:hypothetical protein